MSKLYTDLEVAVKENDGKIPYSFIQEQVANATITHHRLTPNCRVCAITLESGHEVIGVAQVLLASNDDAAIGQKVALQRAEDMLWATLGSIAKLF